MDTAVILAFVVGFILGIAAMIGVIVLWFELELRSFRRR